MSVKNKNSKIVDDGVEKAGLEKTYITGQSVWFERISGARIRTPCTTPVTSQHIKQLIKLNHDRFYVPTASPALPAERAARGTW